MYRNPDKHSGKAILILSIFFFVGIGGIVFAETREFFISLTPLALLLSVMALLVFHQAQRTSEEILIFLSIGPVSFMIETAGAATGPKQVIKTFGERITVPNMNYILLSLLPLILVRKSGFPSLSAANGQFMFFRAHEYKMMQPYRTVRSDKFEDISIARLYKRHKIKTACMLGDESITCRMYSGIRESVSGFSKNVIAFFGYSFSLVIIFWLISTQGFIPVLLSFPTWILIIYLS